MENRNIIIILLLVIIILLVGIGFSFLQINDNSKTNVETTQIENNTVEQSSSSPDTIKVKLTEFDTKVSKTVGEYRVVAEKWEGASVGGFGVWLYKNGELVDKDSYMSRAYFCMDGEWKWSEWGNGQGANYHKYSVSNGVEIQEIEVKF